MADFFESTIRPNFNFWVYVILLMLGLWAVITKRNYIKKLIGLSIFQTALILFYVSIGVKDGATIPIIEHHHGGTEHHAEAVINPDDYANPLPHVLMLTAIVVGVSTLGVALAICQSIFQDFGTLEEDEILAQLKSDTDADPPSNVSSSASHV